MKQQLIRAMLENEIWSLIAENINVGSINTGNIMQTYTITFINEDSKERYEYSFTFHNNNSNDWEWDLTLVDLEINEEFEYAGSSDNYFYLPIERFKEGTPLKTFLKNLTEEILNVYIQTETHRKDYIAYLLERNQNETF